MFALRAFVCMRAAKIFLIVASSSPDFFLTYSIKSFVASAGSSRAAAAAAPS
jgi:hypothetical protein